MLKSPEILVPVDFSPCSVNALRVAIGMAGPDGDLTLLHAIDEQFVSDAVSAALGTAEEIRTRLREQALNSLEFRVSGSRLECGCSKLGTRIKEVGRA